jgi:hypothetical protein
LGCARSTRGMLRGTPARPRAKPQLKIESHCAHARSNFRPRSALHDASTKVFPTTQQFCAPSSRHRTLVAGLQAVYQRGSHSGPLCGGKAEDVLKKEVNTSVHATKHITQHTKSGA